MLSCAPMPPPPGGWLMKTHEAATWPPGMISPTPSVGEFAPNPTVMMFAAVALLLQMISPRRDGLAGTAFNTTVLGTDTVVWNGPRLVCADAGDRPIAAANTATIRRKTLFMGGALLLGVLGMLGNPGRPCCHGLGVFGLFGLAAAGAWCNRLCRLGVRCFVGHWVACWRMDTSVRPPYCVLVTVARVVDPPLTVSAAPWRPK